MPKMTGVEVLSKVRALSPRTVRILLTGYADLDAVEGSINESEVFRFLTKPCAPQQLRETIELAAKLARETPAPAAPEPLTAGRYDRDHPPERYGDGGDAGLRALGRAHLQHGRARAAAVRGVVRSGGRVRLAAEACDRFGHRRVLDGRGSHRHGAEGRARPTARLHGRQHRAGREVLDRATPRRARHRRLRGQGHDPVDDGAAQRAFAAARNDRGLAASRRARHGMAHQSRPDLSLSAQAAVGGADGDQPAGGVTASPPAAQESRARQTP